MSLIDDYLRRQEENRKIRAPNTYYATDLTNPCLRNAYYGATRDEPTDAEKLRIFSMGNQIEDFYVEVLRNTPGVQVIATQLPARYRSPDGGYEVHGKADALCLHDDATLTVHEVKSAKTSSWKSTPNPEHENQIQFYLNTLQLDGGVIDVIDKTIMLHGRDPRNTGEDDPPDTHHHITRDPEAYARLIHRADQLHQAVTAGTPPPVTQCWLCRGYCKHAEQCLRDTPKEEATPPPEPNNL